jgi:integrase/recombinase XerD
VTALAPLLQSFITGRLIAQRRSSSQTIASYRDTFRLLLGFASAKTGKKPCALDIADHLPPFALWTVSTLGS